jgi:L-alanine-DL-glutamate epimerase-like enolase superfamily enzyme
MQITRLEAWPVRMPLSEPYTIAYETVDSTTNVFVRLHTDTPHVGIGCAAPDPYITGETPADVLAALDEAAPVVARQDPTRPAAVYARVRNVIGSRPSTLAALDMAVLDLLGKECGQPVWKVLGGSRASVAAGMTIGILDETATVAEARRWTGQKFRFLKLKGGRDPAGDAVRVRKVREAVGPDVLLAFDANGGFSVEQAAAFLVCCDGLMLQFLEQPTPRDRPDWLAEVQRRTDVPVMADESLVTPRNALELVNGVRLFNVKLMKVGGIQPALAIDAVGEAAGTGVMVGCLDESALSITAGLHFALARPNVWYADLDSHFALVDDPAAGAVVCRDGRLYPNAAPGLGVSLP